MKILVLASGSRGDVQPLLALALKLKAIGHEILFCGPPNFADWVESLEFKFISFGSDLQIIARQHAEIFGNRPVQLLKLLVELLKGELKLQHQQLISLVPEADVVIGASIQLAAGTICEGYKVPYYYIAFAPTIFASSYHAPLTIPFNISNHAANQVLWWINDQVWNIAIKSPVNAYRRQLGLPVLENALDPLNKFQMNTIMAASPEMAPLPPDLQGKVRQTGFLYFFTEEKLPADLEDFLDDKRPVIYLGFGSMTDPAAEKTTGEVIRSMKKTGVKIILSKGWAELGGSGSDDPDIKIIGSISHHILFPRLSAVVHHGGAGTTAAAARSGVPQIIVPHLMDQFYWGQRNYQLGTGPKLINRNSFNSNTLTRAIDEVKNEPGFKKQAQLLREKLIRHDGITEFISILEKDNFKGKLLS